MLCLFSLQMSFQVFSNIINRKITAMTTKIVRPSNVDLNTKIILESKIWSSSFHVAMRFPLQLSQCFGLFPIHVGGLKYESLKIKWFHWRMLYCVLSFGLAAFTLFAQLWQLIQSLHQSLGIS